MQTISREVLNYTLSPMNPPVARVRPGGLEARSVCTLRVEVRPRPAVMTWLRIETPDHPVTIGCARPAEDAFRIAAQEMTAWLEADYGFAQEEAVMLLGQILEARCT